jgi:hypothetical protein
VRDGFLVYGVYFEESNLPSDQLTDDQELVRVLKMPSRASVAMWVVIVHHD